MLRALVGLLTICLIFAPFMGCSTVHKRSQTVSSSDSKSGCSAPYSSGTSSDIEDAAEKGRKSEYDNEAFLADIHENLEFFAYWTLFIPTMVSATILAAFLNPPRLSDPESSGTGFSIAVP